MKQGFIFSALLHVAVFALFAIGLPALRDPVPLISNPIPVEVVTIAPKSNPPPGVRRPPVTKKEPTPKKALASKAEPRKAPEPPKKAPEPPKPKPRKDVAVVPAPPDPPKKAAKKPDPTPKRTKPRVKVEPTVKPEPKPERTEPRVAMRPTDKPEIKPERTTPRVAAKPALKPKPKPAKPRMTLSSILKNVKRMDRKGPRANRDLTEPGQRRGDPSHNPNRQLSMSEMDAVRRQLAQCWNVPAGAKDADKLIVEVKVWMNPDRTVRRARIVNRGRMADPVFRAAAESARRAVLNPQCSPLKLPPNKFETWKVFTVVFDPKEMIGG